ncbi:unnamed protein product, partial [Closterium sp. NIES-53]
MPTQRKPSAAKRQPARNPRPRPALSDVTNDTSAELTASSKPTPASPLNAAVLPSKPAGVPADPCTPAPLTSKGSRLVESGDGAHDDGAEALRSEVSKLLLSTPSQEDTPEIVAKSRSKLTRQSSTPSWNGVTPCSQATLTRQHTIQRCFSIQEPISATYGDVAGNGGGSGEGFAHLDLCDPCDHTPQAVTPLRRRRAAVLASPTVMSAVKGSATLTSSLSLYAAPTPNNSPEEAPTPAPALVRCATSPIPRARSPIPRSTSSTGGVAGSAGGVLAEGGTGRRSRAKWQVGGKIGAVLGKDPAGLLAAINAIREHRGSQQRNYDAADEGGSATTTRRLRSSLASQLSSPALPAGIPPGSRRAPNSAAAGTGGPRVLHPRSPSPMRRARSPRHLSSPAPDHGAPPVSRYQDEIPAVAGNISAGSAVSTPLRTPGSQRGSKSGGESPPWSTLVNVGTPGSRRRGQQGDIASNPYGTSAAATPFMKLDPSATGLSLVAEVAAFLVRLDDAESASSSSSPSSQASKSSENDYDGDAARLEVTREVREQLEAAWNLSPSDALRGARRKPVRGRRFLSASATKLPTDVGGNMAEMDPAARRRAMRRRLRAAALAMGLRMSGNALEMAEDGQAEAELESEAEAVSASPRVRGSGGVGRGSASGGAAGGNAMSEEEVDALIRDYGGGDTAMNVDWTQPRSLLPAKEELRLAELIQRGN